MQLIQDPKYKKIWSTSAANKFGCLAQGVGGRVKGANTIFFICKDQVPTDRVKDMTFGSYTTAKSNQTRKKNIACNSPGGGGQNPLS